ncbi:MAG TPA: adenylate/guanylate cyclase domain-containing protein, partial [Actinomycetota bacterium]|nr:adenylate/guanylate cyclase domain-containing protein [Actinomycetota bacterium]
MAQVARHDGLETSLPVGTITLVLTDIAGSTQLWEQDADAMAAAVRRHHEIFHAAIEQFQGHRPADQGEGDSIFAAFSTATDAVSAILQAQIAIASENWPTPKPLSVRAAIHTGEVELRDGRNYFGPSVNKTARLRGVAHGGQVLVSQVTRDLTQGHLPAGAEYSDLGLHRLKDLSLPEHVYQLTHPGLQSEFPSIKSLDSVANNLPVQLTTLIGRTDEV